MIMIDDITIVTNAVAMIRNCWLEVTDCFEVGTVSSSRGTGRLGLVPGCWPASAAPAA